MKNAAAFSLIAIVPWDEHRGVPSFLVDQPQLGFVVPGQARKARAAVRVRLDAAGGYHLLGEPGGILHLDANGKMSGRTPLPSRADRMIDYVCDAQGRCVLLEQASEQDRPVNRLRGLDASGVELWSHSGPVHPREHDFATLRGTYARLLQDRGGRVFLPADSPGAIAEVDLASGGIRRVVQVRADLGTLFMAGVRFLATSLDTAAGRRGVVAIDPDGGETTEWKGDDTLFAWLVYPFGADASSNLYVWRDGHVARISMRGVREELAAIDGIAVRAGDRQIYTSYPDVGGVAVTGPESSIVLPAPPSDRLVHVDASGRYHLLGGEGPGQVGEVRTYSATGTLESSTSAASVAAIECRVPTHDAWQVDASGRVIIPVVTPDGVAIVAIQPR